MIRKVPRRLKRVLTISAIVIAAFLLLLIVVISPVAKYLVEKYDEKYIGRQVDVGWVYINPVTGYAHIHNLEVFEQKSNNVFFSADGVTVNLSLLKLLSKVYEISRFTLEAPRVRIIQDGDWFNFSDIIEKFSEGEPIKEPSRQPVKFSVKNVRIRDGEFHYLEKQSPINYFIKEVNFHSKGKTWDVDTVNASYSFLSGPGSGSIKGNITFNLKTQGYKAATNVEKFDLKIVEQYVNAMANYGHLNAILDASLVSSGNLNDSTSMSSRGRIAISDLHFGKNENEDYFSFDKLIIKIQEMNLQKGVRVFDTIMLVHPVIKYERYDKLDNIQMMFGAKGSNIDSAKSNPDKFNLVLELADYIKMLSQTFKEDYFRINKFAIQEADIQYSDFSLSEKFSMALNPFNITADSIDKNKEKIIIHVKSLIQPHGEISAQLSVNPENTGYFDLNYRFTNIPAAMFNPYLVTFTSFPLDRGNIEFSGKWNVDNSIVNSENHFIVIDPRVTKKVRRKDTKWIPMPLIMSFVRERGNVIDYEIPIKGNLQDPKFKISDVIADLFKNIFVKPPSSPYIFDVRNVENEVEKSMSIKWKLRTAQFLPNQEKFIVRMAEFLKENPEASLTISPMLYAEKEKEHILLYEAKKKYYITKNNINGKLEEKDSLKIEKMSVKDSAFVRYLNAYVKDSSLYTVQQKCKVYLGEKLVQGKYRSLLNQREKAFLKYFEESKTDSQVKIMAANNIVPFNGFSFYKISYKGDIPDNLMEAYQKLENYDDENPRRQYKRWRE